MLFQSFDAARVFGLYVFSFSISSLYINYWRLLLWVDFFLTILLSYWSLRFMSVFTCDYFQQLAPLSYSSTVLCIDVLCSFDLMSNAFTFHCFIEVSNNSCKYPFSYIFSENIPASSTFIVSLFVFRFSCKIFSIYPSFSKT